MCCDFDFKIIKKFIINFCNGSLYSFDDENEYSDYEMKKKDLTDEQNYNHCSINICEKEQKDEVYKFVAMTYISEYEKNKNEDKKEDNKEKEDWEILL
jgi:hypothetical protein